MCRKSLKGTEGPNESIAHYERLVKEAAKKAEKTEAAKHAALLGQELSNMTAVAEKEIKKLEAEQARLQHELEETMKMGRERH